MFFGFVCSFAIARLCHLVDWNWTGMFNGFSIACSNSNREFYCFSFSLIISIGKIVALIAGTNFFADQSFHNISILQYNCKGDSNSRSYGQFEQRTPNKCGRAFGFLFSSFEFHRQVCSWNIFIFNEITIDLESIDTISSQMLNNCYLFDFGILQCSTCTCLMYNIQYTKWHKMQLKNVIKLSTKVIMFQCLLIFINIRICISWHSFGANQLIFVSICTDF